MDHQMFLQLMSSVFIMKRGDGIVSTERFWTLRHSRGNIGMVQRLVSARLLLYSICQKGFGD